MRVKATNFLPTLAGVLSALIFIGDVLKVLPVVALLLVLQLVLVFVCKLVRLPELPLGAHFVLLAIGIFFDASFRLDVLRLGLDRDVHPGRGRLRRRGLVPVLLGLGHLEPAKPLRAPHLLGLLGGRAFRVLGRAKLLAKLEPAELVLVHRRLLLFFKLCPRVLAFCRLLSCADFGLSLLSLLLRRLGLFGGLLRGLLFVLGEADVPRDLLPVLARGRQGPAQLGRRERVLLHLHKFATRMINL